MVESISRLPDLENPDSAQAQALAWMTADTLGGTVWKSDYDLMQRYVMVVFYYATGGPTWEAQHSFLSLDKPVCEWNSPLLDPMLYCDSQGRVIELDAVDRGLSGILPHELGYLTALQLLYLGQNPNMAGSIPTELGFLGNLLELDVSTSGYEGTIPTELAQLSKLSVLALQDNFLTGTVPEAFGTLSSLKEVYLQATELEGTIPEGFCQNDMWDLEADCVSARPNRQDPKIECNCCTRCYDANETPYDCYNRQGQYFCAPGDSGLPALDEDDEPPNDDEEEEGPPDGERPPPPPPDDGLPPPDDSGKPPKLR